MCFPSIAPTECGNCRFQVDSTAKCYHCCLLVGGLWHSFFKVLLSALHTVGIICQIDEVDMQK